MQKGLFSTQARYRFKSLNWSQTLKWSQTRYVRPRKERAWRKRVGVEFTFHLYFTYLRGSAWTELEGLSIPRNSYCCLIAASFSHPTFLSGRTISTTLLFALRIA